FSSRRRHTRFKCDWSSDVCSSDLSPTQKVTLEALTELLQESDARSLKQFLLTTFDGIGAAGAEKILAQAKLAIRQTPAKLKEEEIGRASCRERRKRMMVSECTR